MTDSDNHQLQTKLPIVLLFFLFAALTIRARFIGVSATELFVWEVLIYLVICTFVWFEVQRAHDYYLDPSAMYVLLFFGFIARTIFLPPESNSFLWLFSILLSLGVSIAVLKRYRSFHTIELKLPGRKIIIQLLWGTLLGVGTAFILYAPTLIGREANFPGPVVLVAFFLVNYFLILPGSAVYEEVIFRGILFSLLRKNGKSPTAAILIQAILFALFHLSPEPIHLTFLAIPLAGIVYALVVYKTNSVTAGIFTHAGLNTAVLIISGIW